MYPNNDLKVGALVSLWCLKAYIAILLLQILQHMYALYSPIIPRYILWDASKSIVYREALLATGGFIAWMAYRRHKYVVTIVLISILFIL